MEHHLIEIFCCTAERDQHYLTDLKNQLRPLLTKGTVTFWDQSSIQVGQNREQEIQTHLNRADVFLLLISADFLASDYCYETVMKPALEKQLANEARVIPVLVRPAHKARELEDIEMLPRGGRAIGDYAANVQVNLLKQIAEEIAQIIRGLLPLIPGLPEPKRPASPSTLARSIATPPSSPSRPPFRGFLLLIVVVCVLLLIGGSVLGTTLIVEHQNLSNEQGTATTQARQTSAASTAQQANATGTAQTQANATATAGAAAPSVLITSPTNGSSVQIVIVIQGTAYNIPSNEDVWVLVLPDGVGAYYPQPGPVVITGNKWSSSAHIGISSNHGLGFTLIVALANQEGDAVIQNYLTQSQPDGSYKGLDPLPNGIFLQSQVHVIRQ